MLPEHFYLTGAGWLGYFIYVPIALFILGLLYWLLLRRIPIIVIRLIILVVLSIPLLIFPLWEALSISYEAEKLCKEQGGLHVYKTVETDGFIGGVIQDASKYGFKYTEGSDGKEKFRWMMVDGHIVKEKIDEYSSNYQLFNESKLINKYFRKSRFLVENISTEEVLGELVKFSIYPSRFDLIILNLLPVESNPWICGNEAPEGQGSYSPGIKKYLYGGSDVIKATLKPRNKVEGEEK